MKITKDLQSISKQLAKLAAQTEKLAAVLDAKDKPKAESIKAKTQSKTVAQKAPVKGVKKTDTETVLAIVNRSKKGVDTATLMKKTGFNQKKIRNILNRTYKQGRITRAEKGIYVGVK